MLWSTFELLPTRTNSIVSFVSINCIWIFFPSPQICLVSRMEEISTQALITAPVLICHLFPRCLKRCFTELFHFKHLAPQNVSGHFQKHLPWAMRWCGIWVFSPRWCAVVEAGRHKRLSTGNSGLGWHLASLSSITPMALVPEASCPQLQNDND